MVYRRRSKFYSKYTTGSRRSRSYRRAPRSSWAGTAYKALTLATKVASIVNSELKHYDEAVSLSPDSSVGSRTSPIRGMAQGDTNNTFDGNSILVKSFFIRGTISIGASATATRVRLALVWDTRPSSVLGTIPAWTDVFSAADVNAMMNIDDQIKRFKVLFDRTYTLSTVMGRLEIPFRIFKKFSRHVKFNDSQVPILNDLILLSFSDEAANTPNIVGYSRLRFYDN